MTEVRTELDPKAFSHADQTPPLKNRYSANWTYPDPRGRSSYSPHSAVIEAVPVGTGKVHDTIELNCPGTVFFVEASTPKKKWSDVLFFWSEQLSAVAAKPPSTICQSSPAPAVTRPAM